MKIAVLGAFQTKFGELWHKSLEDLISEASLGAIKDARINKKQLEIVFLGNKLAGNLNSQNHLSALLAEQLRLNIPVIRTEAACASGGMAVAQACLAIESGNYDLALVVGVEKMTDLTTEEVSSGLMTAADSLEQEAGFSFVGLFALLARKYLADYGLNEEDIAWPAIKNHWHASFNPKAQFPFPISMEKVLASPYIAEPLRLLECSPISDGAAAVILANPKKYFRKNQVYIKASVQQNDSLALSAREKLTTLKTTQLAGRKAYFQAGIEPKDLSLLEIHDCFSIAEIMALEDLGIYKKGQAYLAEKNNELKLGGKRPVNLSGGLKAAGHPVGATGVKQVVEIYNQLKGRAGKRQTANPKIGLAHNLGGAGGTAVVHIMQK